LTLTLLLLGDARLLMGQTRQAVEEYEQASRLDPENPLTKGKLCHAYGLAGRADEARRLLSEIEAPAARERESWVSRAICQLGLGNHPAALDAMETAVKNHEIAVFTAYSPLLDRTWDPVRTDPRWTGILRASSLADYMGNARKP
jgi:tetratricopeptide (TPR) repeat protein